MNILLLGSGGREHALAWKISQSDKCTQLFIAPGNAGTSSCGTNIDVSSSDFDGIKKICLDKHIDMVVVGPEDPLVKGIWDYFKHDDALHRIPVIGPSRSGAQLEGSKDFAKAFMQRHGIPTAAYKTFQKGDVQPAHTFLESLKPPYVLKADGLAAGKGVVILDSLDEAKKEITDMLTNEKFGAASEKVVIEEYLSGIELSVFVLTDGTSWVLLPEAKDYKRIGEGDTGLNTGGMGAVSPVPFAGKDFIQKVKDRIIVPTVNGLKKDKIEYQGFIFIGLMNCGGEPYVIEYNCRMGDPETEVVLPRIKNDLVELFDATAKGTLSGQKIETEPRTAVTVMLVSGGYPESYEKGKPVSGLDKESDSLIFHAGTALDKDRKIVSNGGRVLAITSFGNDVMEAAGKSYTAAREISFDKVYYRKDIGKDLIALEKSAL